MQIIFTHSGKKKLTKYNIGVWSKGLTDQVGIAYLNFKTMYKHQGNYSQYVQFHNFIQPISEDADVIDYDYDNMDCIFIGLYVWNNDYAHQLIHRYPNKKFIVGGPDIDFYDLDFPDNVYAICEGEGEVPIVDVVDCLYTNQSLEGIEGIWIRDNNKFIRPQKKARRIGWTDGFGKGGPNFVEISHSPILDNKQEILQAVQKGAKTIVFNWSLGCPYGCVYCDWGGGIHQKVRGKPIDMIKAEIDFCVPLFKSFYIADANWGLLKTDLEVSEYLRDKMLEVDADYQNQILLHWAKNNLERVIEIKKVLAPWLMRDHKPLQTVNQEVLKTIDRKQPGYQDIIQAYDKADIDNDVVEVPTVVYILGLPGSSVRSTEDDFFTAYDTNYVTELHLLGVFPQTPLAQPDYVAKYNCKFKKGTKISPLSGNTNIVLGNLNKQQKHKDVRLISCFSFSTEDWFNILALADFFKRVEDQYFMRYARDIFCTNNFVDSREFYTPLLKRIYNNDTTFMNGFWVRYKQFYRSWTEGNNELDYAKIHMDFYESMKHWIASEQCLKDIEMAHTNKYVLDSEFYDAYEYGVLPWKIQEVTTLNYTYYHDLTSNSIRRNNDKTLILPNTYMNFTFSYTTDRLFLQRQEGLWRSMTKENILNIRHEIEILNDKRQKFLSITQQNEQNPRLLTY